MKWSKLSTLSEVKTNINRQINAGYLEGLEVDLETEVECSTLEDFFRTLHNFRGLFKN